MNNAAMEPKRTRLRAGICFQYISKGETAGL